MPALRQTPARPTALRAAVVTSGLAPEVNEIWRAASAWIADLLLIGAGSTPHPHDCAFNGQVAPHKAVDLGLDATLIWRHLLGLRRTLRDYRPDVIHVNSELWSLTTQEVLGARAAVVVHGAENLWNHGRTVERALRNELISRALLRTSGYASWNHAGADYARSRTNNRYPTLVMPAIIPPEEFRKHQWKLATSTARQDLRILLVGRLVPLKAFDLVMHAAAMLDAPHRVRVTICGAGPEHARLLRLAEKLDVPLTILGHLPPQSVARLMADSSLLVQPSISTPDNVEQFGRSVAEAMMVGLPCLVSDSGELPLVVGQDTFAVFPEGDVEALSERLMTILLSPDVLVDLSEAQRELAQRYTPSIAGSTVVDFWERALAYQAEV